jgi:N-acetylglucosamine kinase-like BadF-type ATPase
MTVIAIDIGGSGSRIAGPDGQHVAGPALSGGDHPAVIDMLARAHGTERASVDVVAISAARLISRGDPAAIVRAVHRHWRPRLVVVASDAVAAVAGAWGVDGGAVVSAGTGAVGFGTDFAGAWVRSDGWGHVLGDEGGAAWIGARGLRAALRALDGRDDGSVALLAAVRDLHGDPAGLPALLADAPDAAGLLGAFAPRVSAAAAAGDPSAISILTSAGTRLAGTGLSVLAAGVPDRLALVGGLAQQPVVAEAFAAQARARRPGLELAVGPDGASPLDGAMRLGRIAAGRPLPQHPPYLLLDDQPAHI